MHTQNLLDIKSELYRQNLRADSQLLDSINTKGKIRYAKAGGRKQNQVVRSDNSRAHAGSINIANAIKAEAELVYREEYLPFYYEVEAERNSRRTQGFDSRIRKWQEAKLNEINSRIAGLKRQANDLANTVADRHYITNQKFELKVTK